MFQETMREFFPLPHVLKQIFSLIGEHYGLAFELVDRPGREEGRPWCPEVSLYRVTDLQANLRGHFYLDPYIR